MKNTFEKTKFLEYSDMNFPDFQYKYFLKHIFTFLFLGSFKTIYRVVKITIIQISIFIQIDFEYCIAHINAIYNIIV